MHRSEIQFVYPNPEGSKLIFFTPFRIGGMKKIRQQSFECKMKDKTT
jgi:hypothetical protein